MSLLDEYKQIFCVMEKTRIPDGEGGFNTEWSEGAEFIAFPQHNTTIEAQIAESANTASTYTFLIDKGLSLEYHDVVKRLSDGQIFRITSESGEDFTPNSSPLNLTKVMAERWELS